MLAIFNPASHYRPDPTSAKIKFRPPPLSAAPATTGPNQLLQSLPAIVHTATEIRQNDQAAASAWKRCQSHQATPHQQTPDPRTNATRGRTRSSCLQRIDQPLHHESSQHHAPQENRPHTRSSASTGRPRNFPRISSTASAAEQFRPRRIESRRQNSNPTTFRYTRP